MQTTTINAPRTNRLLLEIITFLIILAPVIYALAIWDQLPETMPTHWNFEGQADGWKSRTWASLFLPLVNAGLFLFFLALPNKNYPFKAHFNKFPMIRVLLHALFSLVAVAMIIAAQGYSVNMNNVKLYSFLLLWIILGNYLSTIKSNSKIGIRNRWTLSSEHVWRLTHRFAGRLSVFGSLAVMLANILFPISESMFELAYFVCFTTIIFAPMVYAYVLYKREQREKMMN